MAPIRAATIRSASSLVGVALGAVTLAAAVAVYAIPGLTPVGTAAAVAISATTLSLPLPAAGLAYALHAAPPGVPPRAARALRAAALGVLGLFVAGLLAVATRTEPVRTLGDGLYAAAIVLLVVLSVAVRLAERRDRA